MLYVVLLEDEPSKAEMRPKHQAEHAAYVSTLLGPLRQQDLIARRRDDAHGRRQLLRLTDKAGAVLAQARAQTPAIEEELLGSFTAAERQTLRTLLARIVGRSD